MNVARIRHGKLSSLGIALLSAILLLSLTSGSANATPPSGVTTEVLARGTLPAGTVFHARVNGVNILIKGPEDLVTVHIILSPGGSIGWHSHLGPTLVEVKAGTVVRYEARGCKRTEVNVGGAFGEKPGDVHLVRNESTTQTAETIVTFFVPVGAATRIDEPQPLHCDVS